MIAEFDLGADTIGPGDQDGVFPLSFRTQPKQARESTGQLHDSRRMSFLHQRRQLLHGHFRTDSNQRQRTGNSVPSFLLVRVNVISWESLIGQ